MAFFDDELISIKRRGRQEEIYVASINENDAIVYAKKVLPEEKISCVIDKISKYTSASKVEVVLTAQDLKENLLQDWNGIEKAIECFNSIEFLNKTIQVWEPKNRIGRGEAQFQLLYKTVEKIQEPDFVPVAGEGYSIKYFGEKGDEPALSAEFTDKESSTKIGELIDEFRTILNIPNILENSDSLPKSVNDLFKINGASPLCWKNLVSKTVLSEKDVKKFKKCFTENMVENFGEAVDSKKLLEDLCSRMKNILHEVKEYLLSEHAGQVGIIGIQGNSAQYISSPEQISIVYFGTNGRIHFALSSRDRTSLDRSLTS
jgi:hypothetical protein